MNILDHCTVIPLWDEVTGDPISEAAWHQIRKQGVGGSDAGTLCGVNKYDSVYHLWCMKSGIAQPTDAGEPAEWGHILEKPVAEKYAKDTGQALVEWAVTLRSIEYPFMQANLDFVTVDPCELFPAGKVTTWKRKAPPVGITAIYEGKTGAIASPGSPKDWLETPESIPETYACQGAHYCAVSGLRLVKYGCLLGGHGLVKREMQVSEEFVESLIEVTRSFWEDHVLTGTPPEVDGSDATDEALKGAYPRSVEGKGYDGGEELLNAWNEFQDLKKEASDADDRRKAARARVLALVGDAEYGEALGQTLFTYKSNRDSMRLNQTKLKNEQPAIYESYLESSPGARVLREVT